MTRSRLSLALVFAVVGAPACDSGPESGNELEFVERCAPGGGAGIIGLNEVTITGTADILGPNADVFGNAKVTMAGNVVVEGDVLSAGAVETNGGSFTLDGDIFEGVPILEYEPPYDEAAAAETDNNNSAIPNKLITSGGELKMSGKSELTLPGGVYYFEQGMSMSGQAELTLTGDAKFYVNGPVSISGTTRINGPDYNLEIISISEDDVRISGTSESTMHIIAPLADLRLSGTSDFHGTALGYDVTLTGTNLFNSAGDAIGYGGGCDGGGGGDGGGGSGDDPPDLPPLPD